MENFETFYLITNYRKWSHFPKRFDDFETALEYQKENLPKMCIEECKKGRSKIVYDPARVDPMDPKSDPISKKTSKG